MGWLPYFFLQLLFRAEEGAAVSWESLLYAASLSVLAVLGSLGLRCGYRYLGPRLAGELKWFGLIVLASLGVALLTDLAHHLLLGLLSGLDASLAMLAADQPPLSRAPLLLPSFFAWSLLYLALSRQERLGQAVLTQQSLNLALQEAQLQGLLAQLNPHFMFNTINNIRALILKDADAARLMLGKFADILRYQLESEGDALIRLADELAMVRDYLGLVGLQLGRRLQVEERIDAACLNRRVPRLSLQLLVENAIKHGLGRSPLPGLLRIEAYAEGSVLHVAIRNTGRLKERATSTGIGLTNLEKRLALAFGAAGRFSLCQDGDMVLASLCIEELK